MRTSDDELFEGWCRRRDAQALAQLFDATAPRLLRLAIHLVGDAGTAEDLVQATFLAAIEQRKTLDPSRPVMPWLTGVLANKAQQHRRESAKPIDVERLHERVVEAPYAEFEQRELSGELARAIDRLGEPYRQVLLLRARHGMEIADIAHVLERDPGTVRVQLHRGVEQMRRLLPAALATSLLVGWIAPRGLAAVKASVLGEAAAAATAGSSTGIVGGLLVSKKLVAAACLAVIAALLFVSRQTREEAQPDAAVAQVAERASAAPAQVEQLANAAGEVAIDPARESVPTARDEATAVAGVVVDAETGAPIAGARVALFAGRATTSYELQRDRDTFYGASVNGRLQPRTRADWPMLVGASEVGHAGRGTLIALDVPNADDEALERTASDAHGGFRLSKELDTGLLEVASPGYATRWRPFVEGAVPATIALWRERELHGRLIGPQARPVTETLELAVVAATQSLRASPASEPSDEPVVLSKRSEREGLECRRVNNSSDGTFQVRLGAQEVSVDVLTPGWKVTLPAVYSLDGSPIDVHVARVPVLHFFDATSGAPIERVRILGRELRGGYVRWSGELSAPGGRASVPGDYSFWRSHSGATLAFSAWAEGYEPTSWSIVEVESSAVIEVAMRPGSLAAIEGFVRHAGAPLEGAEISLLGYSPLQWTANDEYSTIVDAAFTRAGKFRLEAAAGKYVLRVHSAAKDHHRVVELPAQTPLVVDLERLGSIDAEVVDQNGAARIEHIVALRSGDGFQAIVWTDSLGRSVFPDLPAGHYTVMTPHVSTKFSFSADVSETIELIEGQRASVQLKTRASTAPRHVRVLARGTLDYSSWRARFGEGEWVALGADGTVPLDLATDQWGLDVEAEDGRRWSMDIPKDAPDGTVIELELGDASYEGELLDAGGDPLVAVKISAQPLSECAATTIAVECVTDEHGRFRVGGLQPCRHLLLFELRSVTSPITFMPASNAAREPTWISIRWARPEQSVLWRGVVRDEAGQPVGGASVSVDCEIPQASGVLRVGSDRSFTHAGADGSFEMLSPRTPRASFRVHAPDGSNRLGRAEFLDDGAQERSVELVLPRAP